MQDRCQWRQALAEDLERKLECRICRQKQWDIVILLHWKTTTLPLYDPKPCFRPGKSWHREVRAQYFARDLHRSVSMDWRRGGFYQIPTFKLPQGNVLID